VQRWVRDLNAFYRETPALYERDFTADGFEWIDVHDHENSVLSFLRKARNGKDVVIVVCNFTPVPRENYRVGVPHGGRWIERLNSDAHDYGGSGKGNFGGVEAAPLGSHGRTHSVYLTVPPLGVLYLTPA
jgi:1,4-alpha-glucan branching enzyme